MFANVNRTSYNSYISGIGSEKKDRGVQISDLLIKVGLPVLGFVVVVIILLVLVGLWRKRRRRGM